MLNQNFKFAIRYIISNKIYSVLNLAGLVLGLALSIVVYLIIFQEISYDRFHKDLNQIFQVMQYEKKETRSIISYDLSYTATEALTQRVPEFDFITMVPSAPAPSLRINEHSLNEHGIYADPDFFNVFSFKIIEGDMKNILEGKDLIIISEELAAKYFQGQDPIGKIINTQGTPEQIFTVAGILEDVPLKSTLQPDYIIPIENFFSAYPSREVKKGFFNVYVKLNRGADQSAVNDKILSIASEADFEEDRDLFLFPYSKIHVLPVKYKDASAGGMIGAIIGLSIIGFLILFVACINYTNLATALSLKRTKDTGVKKIFGSSRNNLTFQFLLESFILSSVALIFGLIVANLIVPGFNRLFNWNLTIDYSDPLMITGLLSILIFTTLLSGTYPAFYLSRLNPLKILKGTDKRSVKNSRLRNVLVIIQFFFAVMLIIISVTSIKQINYIKNKELGVNIDNMLMFRLNPDLVRYGNSIKDEILKLSSVKNVTLSSQNPLLIWGETRDIDYDGKGTVEAPAFSVMGVDYDFVKTMDLKMTGGRNFDTSLITDSSSLIINETAARVLGSEISIGSRLTVEKREGTIIGIINDYHMTHMNFPIRPLIVTCNLNSYSTVIVKMHPGTDETVTNQVKEIIERFEKGSDTRIIKMSDAFEDIYDDNVFKIAKLSIIFSLLALWIACIGLVSLSMFNCELRTKEIGIHRVNGAGVLRIIRMLTLEYISRVLFSLIFAIPAGYLIVNKLFSRTAYHTDISLSIFLIASTIVMVIAFCTVGWQAYRLALKNPAETLKYE